MKAVNETQASYRGPSTGIVALVSVSLFVASLIISTIMTAGTPFPTLFSSLEEVHNYFLHFAGVVQFNTMLQFGSAIPLGIFTASITNKLQFHGARVAGVNIATFGGYTAAIFIAISALAGWVLVQPGVADDLAVMRSLQLFEFITGGVAHVVALGLLLAGVSIPALFMKLIPKWMVWLGLITAVFAELATFSMFFPKLFLFIPLGRFPAFVWMVAVGFAMPKKRKDDGMPA